MPTDPFRTRDHVPDFEGKVREYERRSAEVRLLAQSPGPEKPASLRDGCGLAPG